MCRGSEAGSYARLIDFASLNYRHDSNKEEEEEEESFSGGDGRSRRSFLYKSTCVRQVDVE